MTFQSWRLILWSCTCPKAINARHIFLGGILQTKKALCLMPIRIMIKPHTFYYGQLDEKK